MNRSTRILLGCACIAALLAAFFMGTASAAIVPFNGIEYSWLHHDDDGEPVADWIKRINDVAPVRNGDAMQFQNRWYNSYAGTTDLRISWGGEVAGTCTGDDFTVHYGLNYGNYYPSGTESVPYYSTVLSCSKTPQYLMVTHQYVFNGILYGTLDPSDRSMMFQWRADINDSRVIHTTPTPAPNATSMPVTPATVTPAPTPGFGSVTLIALAAALAIAYSSHGIVKKR